MYFNRYIFDCYLQTDSARETKNFFENLSVWVKEEKWKEIYSYLFKQGYTQESEGYWIETFVFIQNLLENFSDWEQDLLILFLLRVIKRNVGTNWHG